jgi:hypothetical protein
MSGLGSLPEPHGQLGSMQSAAVCTRPDVSTTLGNLGYAHASPTEAHLQGRKTFVRYMKGTPELRMALGGGDHNLQLTCSADADWANDSRQSKSRSDYLFTLGRGPVN